ncbi:MAG TPA: hypothetical protein VKP64_03415 [Mycobacteriales bacterium]|nr:hypothetical protein [Mycobacteriales bacterium]
MEGGWKRKTVYGSTQRDVLHKITKIRRAVDEGVALSTSRPPTLAEYGATWLGATLATAVHLGHLKQSTQNSYEDQWRRHIEPALGRYRLDALTPAVLRSWLAAKSSKQSARGRPLSPRTVRYLHAILRKALTDAVRDGLVARNVAMLVEPPRGGGRRVQPLSDAEAGKLLGVAAGDRLAALWYVYVGLGLRRGEGLNLMDGFLSGIGA